MICHQQRNGSASVMPPAGYAAGVVLLAVAVYLNSLGNGFSLDDVPIIQQNPRVHDVSNLRGVWLTPYWPFSGSELGLWRPLAVFGYALQWAAGGGHPMLFHATSITLHAGAALLVFLLLARLFSPWPALAGGVVFAVHPVHTEVVANVVGQAELIVAIAATGACLLHAARAPGIAVTRRRSAALATLFAAGLLAKENAVVIPGLLVATDLAQRRVLLSFAGAWAYARQMLPVTLSFGAVLLAYAIARSMVLDGAVLGTDPGPQLHYLHGEYRVLNALRAMPEMLRLIIFPAALAADYSPAMVLPVENWEPMVIAGALALLGIAGLTLAMPWHPAAGFAAAWFLISVLPVSNLLFPIGVLVAERTLYLPSMAVSAAVAAILASVWPRASTGRRRALAAALVVLTTAGGVRTWVRNPDWASTRSILAALMRDHPESYKAQWTHAAWQWHLGNHESARFHYEMAAATYPLDTHMMAEFATFLIDSGAAVRAAEILENALRMRPTDSGSIVLLAAAYMAQNRPADVLDLVGAASARGVPRAITVPLEAAAYDRLGHTRDAAAAARYAAEHGEMGPAAWLGIARILVEQADTAFAIQALERGLPQAAGDTAGVRRLMAVRARLAAPQ